MSKKLTHEESDRDALIIDCVREILGLKPLYSPEKHSPIYSTSYSPEDFGSGGVSNNEYT